MQICAGSVFSFKAEVTDIVDCFTSLLSLCSLSSLPSGPPQTGEKRHEGRSTDSAMRPSKTPRDGNRDGLPLGQRQVLLRYPNDLILGVGLIVKSRTCCVTGHKPVNLCTIRGDPSRYPSLPWDILLLCQPIGHLTPPTPDFCRIADMRGMISPQVASKTRLAGFTSVGIALVSVAYAFITQCLWNSVAYATI